MSQVAASELNPAVETPASARRVVTRGRFAAPPERVWSHLLYYEQIEEPPPWPLRRLLPTPLRTLGSKTSVGDEATCEYVGGWLKKRVVEIEAARLYRFVVVEQQLPLWDVQLLGGAYALRPLSGGTQISLETHYLGGRSPRALWEPLERRACHAFHRHILSAMRRALSER